MLAEEASAWTSARIGDDSGSVCADRVIASSIPDAADSRSLTVSTHDATAPTRRRSAIWALRSACIAGNSTPPRTASTAIDHHDDTAATANPATDEMISARTFTTIRREAERAPAAFGRCRDGPLRAPSTMMNSPVAISAPMNDPRSGVRVMTPRRAAIGVGRTRHRRAAHGAVRTRSPSDAAPRPIRG